MEKRVVQEIEEADTFIQLFCFIGRIGVKLKDHTKWKVINDYLSKDRKWVNV